MDYRNSEMKLDQLISYFNQNKINLIPPFQRGHVWKLPARKKLIKNIVSGRPIPAVFLYKEPDGSQYTYNILDGKQRLESLLLFIGNKRQDVRIDAVTKYFFSEKEKKSVNFEVETPEGKKAFGALSDDAVRDFREYSIPTIEINLEDRSLDEIIELFVDINQQGSKVTRFDIVKAIGDQSPLLANVFDLIAEKQKRRHDIFYKKKQTTFSRVLTKLQTIQALPEPNAKVDRMWERLLEIVLFCRTQKHRGTTQILKSFIHTKDSGDRKKISPSEMRKLKGAFAFLASCYTRTELGKTRLATDQTHFYTMVTSLLATDLLWPQNGKLPDISGLRAKLLRFARIIDSRTALPKDRKIAPKIREYRQASAKQTTHPGQREDRQRLFLSIISDI